MEYQKELSKSYLNISDTYSKLGENDKSLLYLFKKLKCDKFVTEKLNTKEFVNIVYEDYEKLITAYEQKSMFDKAVTLVCERVKFDEILFKKSNTIDEKKQLYTKYNAAADYCEKHGNSSFALKFYKAALNINSGLLQNTNNSSANFNLAEAYMNFALFLERKQKLSEADSAISSCVAYLNELANNINDNKLFELSVSLYEQVISYYLRNQNYKQTLNAYQSVINIYHILDIEFDNCEKLQNSENIIEAVNQKYLEKINICNICINNNESGNYKEILAQTYTDFANVLSHCTKYNNALEFYNKSINLYLELSAFCNDSHIKNSLAETYENVAMVYAMQNKFDKAFEFCQKSFDLTFKINSDVQENSSKKALAKSYELFGLLHEFSGNEQCALLSYEKSLELIENFESSITLKSEIEKLYASYTNIGLFYEQQQNTFKTSTLLYNKSNALATKFACIAKETPCGKETALGLIDVADNYFCAENYTKALQSYSKAIKIGTDILSTQKTPDFKNIIANSHMSLGNIYQIKKDNEKAIENYKLSIKLKMNILNMQTAHVLRYDLAVLHNRLSLIYKSINNIDDYYIYFKSRLDFEKNIAEDLKSIEVYENVMQNYDIIAKYYEQQQNYKKSIEINIIITDICKILSENYNCTPYFNTAADLCLHIANLHLKNGDSFKADNHYKQYIYFKRQFNNKLNTSESLRELANAYGFIANIYNENKYYFLELDYLKNKIEIVEKLLAKLKTAEIKNELLQLLLDAANISMNEKHRDDALKLYNRYTVLKESLLNNLTSANEHQLLADTYGKTAILYKENEDSTSTLESYKKCIKYNNKAIKKLKPLSNQFISVFNNLLVSHWEVAVLYANEKNYKVALKNYKKSLSLFNKMCDDIGLQNIVNYKNLSVHYGLVAQYCHRNEDVDNAMLMYKKCCSAYVIYVQNANKTNIEFTPKAILAQMFIQVLSIFNCSSNLEKSFKLLEKSIINFDYTDGTNFEDNLRELNSLLNKFDNNFTECNAQIENFNAELFNNVTTDYKNKTGITVLSANNYEVLKNSIDLNKIIIERYSSTIKNLYSTENIKDVADHNDSLAYHYKRLEKYDDTLTAYKKCADILDFIAQQSNTKDDLTDLAQIYYDMGSFCEFSSKSDALKYYELSIKYYKQINAAFNCVATKLSLIKKMRYLAIIYVTQKSYKNALAFFLNLIELFKELSIDESDVELQTDYADCYNYLANVYECLENYESSFNAYEKSFEILSNIPDKYLTLRIYKQRQSAAFWCKNTLIKYKIVKPDKKAYYEKQFEIISKIVNKLKD